MAYNWTPGSLNLAIRGTSLCGDSGGQRQAKQMYTVLHTLKLKNFKFKMGLWPPSSLGTRT